MRLQTTSPDTSSIGFTDGLDGVIDMTVAANRARKKMLDVVRKGAGEAFGEISRGVPKEYHGVLEGIKTLGRAAFDFITPSTERPTREQFIEESAMNLSPVPVAFAGVHTLLKKKPVSAKATFEAMYPQITKNIVTLVEVPQKALRYAVGETNKNTTSLGAFISNSKLSRQFSELITLRKPKLHPEIRKAILGDKPVLLFNAEAPRGTGFHEGQHIADFLAGRRSSESAAEAFASEKMIQIMKAREGRWHGKKAFKAKGSIVEETRIPGAPELMGVYTKRTLATMKALGENAEGDVINVSPDSRMFVSKNTKPEIVPKSIRSAVMSQGEIFPTAEGHERAIQLAKDYFGPNFIETDITKGWWGKTPRGKERFIALENSPDTDDPRRIAQAMSSGGRWRVTQLMKSNDEWVPLDHRTFSRKGLALKYATERGNKAEPFGVPPPGEITRSLVRGDLEAGVPFRQVAGGGSRLKVESMLEDYGNSQDVRTMAHSIISTLRSVEDEPAAQMLISQAERLIHQTAKAKRGFSFVGELDDLVRATRKTFPQLYIRFGDASSIRRTIEHVEGSHAFENIRATRRGEYPFSRNPGNEDRRLNIQRIETERAAEGPMAFGPSEWVNTRPQLNPEGVPETGWEYALRGSRGIEHRAGLPPGLRTPVGDLLEERHAIRAPGIRVDNIDMVRLLTPYLGEARASSAVQLITELSRLEYNESRRILHNATARLLEVQVPEDLIRRYHVEVARRRIYR